MKVTVLVTWGHGHSPAKRETLCVFIPGFPAKRLNRFAKKMRKCFGEKNSGLFLQFSASFTFAKFHEKVWEKRTKILAFFRESFRSLETLLHT